MNLPIPAVTKKTSIAHDGIFRVGQRVKVAGQSQTWFFIGYSVLCPDMACLERMAPNGGSMSIMVSYFDPKSVTPTGE
jgi:hypothetical protein